VLKANHTFLTWTGQTLEEVIGLGFVDLLTPGARIFHETHYLPLLHLQGHVDELSVEMLRADGTRFPTLLNAVMDRDVDGEPLLVRIAVFDATERRSYEREILLAQQRAEAAEAEATAAEAKATRLAQTLQQTLMPPRSPQIPGIELATAFRPAGSGAEIGGDFYDIFAVADGDWVVTIGDVAGKGAEAAVVATLARHTIRALSVSETSPAAILSDLNQVLYTNPSDRFCTIALLRLHQGHDGWNVTLGLGGHPAPLVMDQTNVPREISEPSYLVGAIDFATYSDIHFELRPGMTLLLHTDGITEARRATELYGEERLRQFLHDNIDRPEALLGHLLEDVLVFQGGNAKDDIALVALHVIAGHQS
jgi:sigma-B regulation protein RsbU (phosphoserine phosphatase)